MRALTIYNRLRKIIREDGMISPNELKRYIAGMMGHLRIMKGRLDAGITIAPQSKEYEYLVKDIDMMTKETMKLSKKAGIITQL